MWTLIRVGGVGENYGGAHKEFMIDSESDLENIDTNGVAPGSKAYTPGHYREWEMDLIGNWTEVGVEYEDTYTLTVTVKDKSVTYDGTEQSGYTIETVEGTGETIDTTYYTVTGLEEGHVLKVIYTPKNGKDVGSYGDGAFESVVVTNNGINVTAAYTSITANAGALAITKKAVTMKSASKTKTYDGTALVNGETALNTETGWVDGEGATYTFTGSQTNAGTSTNSFTYALNEGTDAGNYNITKTEGTLEVTLASATVTADNKEKTVGGDDPALTATVTGLVNDEPATTITYTISRAEGETAGEYTITPTGNATQGNYSVSYVTGTLTINAAE